MFKNILKSLLIFLISITISTLILTILNYFNILNSKITSILKFLIPTTSISIISYLLGKKAMKKGYIEGLKFGGIITIIFSIITLLFKNFNTKSIIYYIILLLSSTLSSMIGINNKKTVN